MDLETRVFQGSNSENFVILACVTDRQTDRQTNRQTYL